MKQSLICLMLVGLSGLGNGACTHHYIPVAGMQSGTDALDLRSLDLKETKFTLECRWKPIYGKYESAGKLCRYVESLLVAMHGQTEKDSDDTGENSGTASENQGDSSKAKAQALHMQIEIRSLPERSSQFEQVLLWVSYGFYPASTDSWHTADVRIFDENGYLLRQGDFRALFRTYEGWGYWLYHQGKQLLPGSRRPQSPETLNSIDFYQFVGRLAFDAAHSAQERRTLLGQGDGP